MARVDDPPYVRIAGDIRRRIVSGELPPGARVPSTRAIVRRWHVAMATATKVLATLRQDGLVRSVPGAGTVVVAARGAEHHARAPRRKPTAGHQLSLESVVRVAIELADAEGIDAVSMRRVATELGVATMALYRHVPGKDELVAQMAEKVFGEPLARFRDCILARSTISAVEMELYNPNYVGGDINGGVQDLSQLYARPTARIVPYSTPVEGLYICSASTPPGGGVHGMCGYHAARAVLEKHFVNASFG